jgi:hypothetical protein
MGAMLATLGLVAGSCSGGGSSPKVSEAWAVPTPAGYVALTNAKNDHLLGVQTLKSASYRRPGLRQAGWRSSIAEEWAPTALVRSARPYSIDQTINLTIDQFGSSTEAASYQRKLAAMYLERGPGEGPIIRLTVEGVPGAVAVEQQDPGTTLTGELKLTYVVVAFPRGPYLVTLGGGETHFSVGLERLLEHMAEAQYGRLPH